MPAKLKLNIDASGFGKLSETVHRQLGQVVHATAVQVEAHAKIAIQTGPKTGRVYEQGETEVSFTTKTGNAVSFTARKGQASKLHQASAPGEAPATDTGNLVNSVQTRRTGDLAAEVSASAEYGAALEFGTEDGHIAPRPFLGPALDTARPGFEAAVAAVIRRGGQ